VRCFLAYSIDRVRIVTASLAFTLFLGWQAAYGQGCAVAGISCQSSSVRLNATTESEVLKVFQPFAASPAENFACRTLPGAPHISLSCERADGVRVEVRRDADRVWFVSRAPFGLKGSDTLRAFNARLASVLAGHFKDAVEATRDAAPAPKVDYFSGQFLSESSDQFGTSTPGEVRIEITLDGATYLMNYFRNEKLLFTTRAEECDPRRYPIALNDWTDANVSGLCTPRGGMQMLYTERGLMMPTGPNLTGRRHYQSRYYSHVQFGFYAFRKVN